MRPLPLFPPRSPFGTPPCSWLLIVTLTVLPGRSLSHAAEGAGAFLEVGFGVRSIGLGNSGRAMAAGPEALYWNPANLARVRETEGMAMHAEQFNGIVQADNLAVVLPEGSRSEAGIGLGLIRVAVPDVPRTAGLDWLDHGADGIPDSGDAGDGNGEWDPGERVIHDASRLRFDTDEQWAALLGYGFALSPTFDLGVTAKVIHQEIADASSWGGGVDLGVTYRPGARLAFALSLVDVGGTRLFWSTGRRERVPMRVAASQVTRVTTLGRGIDLSLALDGSVAGLGGTNETSGNYGIELSYHELVRARVGLNQGEWAAGAGFRVARLGADYAFVGHQDLGGTHRVGVSYRLEARP